MYFYVNYRLEEQYLMLRKIVDVVSTIKQTQIQPKSMEETQQQQTHNINGGGNRVIQLTESQLIPVSDNEAETDDEYEEDTLDDEDDDEYEEEEEEDKYDEPLEVNNIEVIKMDFCKEDILDIPEEKINVVEELPEETIDLPEETIDLPEETIDLPEETIDLPEETIDLPEDTIDLPEEVPNAPIDFSYLKHVEINLDSEKKEEEINVHKMSLSKLRELAKKRGFTDVSKLTKKEIIQLL
jgi:hypothetical protein